MKKLLILLSFCVLFSLSGTLSNAHSSQRNKALVLKNKLQLTNKNFIGLLLVPYIICFFAATGIWPHYPQYMQNSVNEMGQQIFAQSDDYIRNFCRGKFLFNSHQAYRPVFFKGFVFGKGDVFQPIDDWGPKTTMTTKADTTMRTKAELTETTTLMTTITTTTTTTTTTEATTTPDRDVVTFDPQQPPTTICNCNNNNNVPRLVKPNDEKISTQHSSARSAPATTQPTHIKIEVKNVISIIDLILSYLNVTRSNP